MILYRGSSSPCFEVKKSRRSRYGFSALFFTSSLELARLYAQHRAAAEGRRTGYVYDVNIARPRFQEDFRKEVSHSLKFRQLIYRLQRQRIPSARIVNVIDYPSADRPRLLPADVVVVFDLDTVGPLRRIEEITI